jgi:toxin YoeB
MSNNVSFTPRGLNEYIYWQTEDRRTLKKINSLIKDIVRSAKTGIGSPEPLKGKLVNSWSREIDDKNRLIYRIMDNGDIEILQCKGHYDDK